jgi:hypothetical protein
MMLAERYQIVRRRDAAGLFHPVEDATGRALSLPELEVLARAPLQIDTRRHLDCVLGDEAPPRNGGPAIRPQVLHVSRTDVPLTFLDTELAIGTIQDALVVAPGHVPDTIGFALLGTVALHDTVLADIAWRALQEGLFGGLCMSLLEWRNAEGLFTSGELQHVILGDQESSHLANARVLRLREEPTQGCP